MKDQLQKEVDDLIHNHSVVSILDCIAQNAIDHAKALDNVQLALKPFRTLGPVSDIRTDGIRLDYLGPTNLSDAFGQFGVPVELTAVPFHRIANQLPVVGH